MDARELVVALERAGVATSSYWLEGGLPFERYCLERRSNGWAVYYSEHGLRTGEIVFETEDEACSELYSMLVTDPTTRKGPLRNEPVRTWLGQVSGS